MAFLWSLVGFLSSKTAGTIGKFIYNRLESFLNGKNAQTLTSKDTAKLRNQSSELKKIYESIQTQPVNEPVSEKIVTDLGRQIVELEAFQRKKKLPEALISQELFEHWIENEPLEENAFIAHKRLGLLIDWCLKNKVRETKRWQIEQVSNNLAMFTNNLKKARINLQGNPNYMFYQQQVMEAEIAIRANLSSAKALFVEYSCYGG